MGDWVWVDLKHNALFRALYHILGSLIGSLMKEGELNIVCIRNQLNISFHCVTDVI